MRKSNLTYEQLIELAPKDRPFQIKIQYFDKKIYTSWAILSPVFELDFEKEKTSIRYELFVQDYKKRIELITEYDFLETLTLIDEYRNMYEKPEVLKVGTIVKIMESGKVVKTGKIKYVEEDGLECSILFSNSPIPLTYPHYCVRPVEKVEEKEEESIPGFEDMFGDMIEEFEGLCIKAQDIITKYKK